MDSDTMTSSADLFGTDDTPALPPVIIDRSTAERWATCPHQASLIENKMVSTGNELTDVGNEVHGIMSAAVWHRVDGVNFGGLIEEMKMAAIQSRPDIQPQVIDALNIYKCASLICFGDTAERHPDDILRFDGGKDDKSGQLSAEIVPATDERGAVIATGELDFLAATASVEEVDYLDWKSGWRHWTAGAVEQSFQFQWYALLIFLNYPKVMRVRVRVVETRTGNTTAPYVFTRERHQQAITARVRSAIDNLLHHRGMEIENVPAWPSPEKCATCDAALRCKLAYEPAADVARDPEGAIRQYIVLTTAADRLKASLSVAVRKQGHDFDFGDVMFGSEKPKTMRAPTCDVYEPIGRPERKSA